MKIYLSLAIALLCALSGAQFFGGGGSGSSSTPLPINTYAASQMAAFVQEIAVNGVHTYNEIVNGDSRVDGYGVWATKLKTKYNVQGGIFQGALLLNEQGDGTSAHKRPDGTTNIPSGNWSFGTSGGTLSAWTTTTASTSTGYTYGNAKAAVLTAEAANSASRPRTIWYQDYGTNDIRLGTITEATFLQRLKDAFLIIHNDFPNDWFITNMQVLGPFASGANYITAPDLAVTTNGWPAYNDGSSHTFPPASVLPTFTVTCTAGVVASVTTNTAGSGLPSGTLFAITSNNGIGATISVTISGGAVSGNPTVVTGGGGYTSATVSVNANTPLSGWQTNVDAYNDAIRRSYDAFQLWANQNGYKVIVVDTHRRMLGMTAAGVLRYNPLIHVDSLHPGTAWSPEDIFTNDIAAELAWRRYSNNYRNEAQFLSGSTSVNDTNLNPMVAPHTIDIAALQDPISYDLVYDGTCSGASNSSTGFTFAMDYGQLLPNGLDKASVGGWTKIRTGDIVLFGPASSDVNYPGYAWQIPTSAVSLVITRSAQSVGRFARNTMNVSGATSGTIVPSGVVVAAGSRCRVYRFKGNAKAFDPNTNEYLGDPNWQILNFKENGTGNTFSIKFQAEDAKDVFWNMHKFQNLMPGDVIHFVGYPNDYTLPAGVYADFDRSGGNLVLLTGSLTDPNGIAWAYPGNTSIIVATKSPKAVWTRPPSVIALQAPPSVTLVNGTKCGYAQLNNAGYVDRCQAQLLTVNTTSSLTVVIHDETANVDVGTVTFTANSGTGTIAWSSGSSYTYNAGTVFSFKPTAAIVNANGLFITLGVQ